MWRKRTLVDEAHVMSLNVVSLKELCLQYKLTTKGMKANLRNRILEHLKLGKYAQSAASETTKKTVDDVVSMKTADKGEMRKVDKATVVKNSTTTVGKNSTTLGFKNRMPVLKKVQARRNNQAIKKWVKPTTKVGQWNKKKRSGISRSTFPKSKAMKRQMSSHKTYQQRRTQKQVWERSQPIQSWRGNRSSQQNRNCQGNNHGFQNEGLTSSWLIPGKNDGRSKRIQNQKRSFFITGYNANGQRSGGDQGWERQSRDSSMRGRRVR